MNEYLISTLNFDYVELKESNGHVFIHELKLEPKPDRACMFIKDAKLTIHGTQYLKLEGNVLQDRDNTFDNCSILEGIKTFVEDMEEEPEGKYVTYKYKSILDWIMRHKKPCVTFYNYRLKEKIPITIETNKFTITY